MDRTSWLDTAVSGIRFGPDRRAVRAELEGHIEDKTADLRRIFPDIPEEEARDRTLAGMGDPEELKISLAKVHRPWLGWLWTASRWALWVTLLALNLVALGTRTDYDNSLRGRSGTEVYGSVRDGEQARLGQYTFRITAAAYLDVPEDGVREDTLQLVLRASSPRFWERLSWEGLYDSLTAVGPDGTRYPMDRQDIRMDESKGIYQVYTGAVGCRWGIFWRAAAVLACLDRSYNSFIREVPLDGGPTLAPLARHDWYLDTNGYWVTQGPGETPEGHPAYVYKHHNFSAFLLFGAPQGTVRAELTVLDGGVERTGGGWALENGVWLLGVEDGKARDKARDLVSEIPYTLRLYDASDTLLAERSGRLWEE